MVLACHLLAPVRSGTAAGAKMWHLVTGLGWTGVDLFFVLSGFLITGILLDTRADDRYLVNFFGRRILRVFPLYYTLLAVGLAAGLTRAGDVFGWAGLACPSAGWYWGLLGNVPMITGRGSDTSLFVGWSLAVEEQFYLVWPLLIAVLPRRAVAWTCLGVVVGSPAIRLAAERAGLSPVAVYFCTPCRLDGLMVGALVAIAFRSPWAWARVERLAPVLAVAAAATCGGIIAVGRQPLFHWQSGWPSAFTYSAVAALYGSVLIFTLGPAGGVAGQPPAVHAGQVQLRHLPVAHAGLRGRAVRVDRLSRARAVADPADRRRVGRRRRRRHHHVRVVPTQLGIPGKAVPAVQNSFPGRPAR